MLEKIQYNICHIKTFILVMKRNVILQQYKYMYHNEISATIYIPVTPYETCMISVFFMQSGVIFIFILKDLISLISVKYHINLKREIDAFTIVYDRIYRTVSCKCTIKHIIWRCNDVSYSCDMSLGHNCHLQFPNKNDTTMANMKLWLKSLFPHFFAHTTQPFIPKMRPIKWNGNWL